MLLPKKDSLNTAMFQHYVATSILSNNTNELIGARQQGGVMTIVKGDIAKYAISTGADPTGLNRWNYIDIVDGTKQLRIIYACQSVISKSSLGIMHSQRRIFFLVRSIDIFLYYYCLLS